MCICERMQTCMYTCGNVSLRQAKKKRFDKFRSRTNSSRAPSKHVDEFKSFAPLAGDVAATAIDATIDRADKIASAPAAQATPTRPDPVAQSLDKVLSSNPLAAALLSPGATDTISPAPRASALAKKELRKSPPPPLNAQHSTPDTPGAIRVENKWANGGPTRSYRSDAECVWTCVISRDEAQTLSQICALPFFIVLRLPRSILTPVNVRQTRSTRPSLPYPTATDAVSHSLTFLTCRGCDFPRLHSDVYSRL